ncbi:hypothetical protein LTR84_002920 [Exophiala bonariae]|uniref:Uncharacterized protein n=1 Tax=Exophiala bonariae TaxID=1690606 RepID=A0AAV9N8Y6_9EURO|nr:hypothetical protein LTR84_002920 [Exophiala bonariae]
MRSTLIAKILLSLEALLLLSSLVSAAPKPATNIPPDPPWTYSGFMIKYEKEHPGSKVGPSVAAMGKNGVPADQGYLDIAGNFNLSGIPKDSMHMIKLDCNGNCKPFTRIRYVDARKPAPTRTCVGDALVAVAQYRFNCLRTNPLNNVACWWAHPPSIDHCCGEWIESDSPEAKKAYPVRKKEKKKLNGQDYFVFTPITEKRKNEKGKKVIMNRVIAQSSKDYKMNVLGCADWKARDDYEYGYFKNNLDAWGILDADKEGVAERLFFPWYEPVIPEWRINSKEPQAGDEDYHNRSSTA